MASIADFLTPTLTLPVDAANAILVGRIWLPAIEGPCIVKLEGERLVDITPTFPTMRDLCEAPDPAAAARAARGQPVAAFPRRD